jgi:hypothetical protein
MKNFPEYKLETYDDVFLYTNSNTIGSNIDKYIFFRNRNNERKKDVEIMKYIINTI